MKFLRTRAFIFWFVGLFPKIVAWIAFIISFMRSPYQLLRAWPEGTIPLGPKVALFVHFDGSGMVRPHVLRYVTMLRDAGFSVVLVTNSGRLRDDGMKALQEVCAGVLIRRNIGYDFGAMREGLAHLKLPRDNTELLLLANDSVYGPIFPLAPILDRIDFEQADCWGATDSWQSRFHLQSYFIAVGRRAMTSQAWKNFWRKVRPVQSKGWVIWHYEVGLTQELARRGLRFRALWQYTDLVKLIDPYLLMSMTPGEDERPFNDDPALGARRSHAYRIRQSAFAQLPLNPTSDLWRQLLLAGCPFIKRELLRENPSGVLDASDWREVVAKLAPDTIELIDRDLQRVLRNRSP